MEMRPAARGTADERKAEGFWCWAEREAVAGCGLAGG